MIILPVDKKAAILTAEAQAKIEYDRRMAHVEGVLCRRLHLTIGQVRAVLAEVEVQRAEQTIAKHRERESRSWRG